MFKSICRPLILGRARRQKRLPRTCLMSLQSPTPSHSKTRPLERKKETNSVQQPIKCLFFGVEEVGSGSNPAFHFNPDPLLQSRAKATTPRATGANKTCKQQGFLLFFFFHTTRINSHTYTCRCGTDRFPAFHENSSLRPEAKLPPCHTDEPPSPSVATRKRTLPVLYFKKGKKNRQSQNCVINDGNTQTMHREITQSRHTKS